jgi:hypothetical protein
MTQSLRFQLASLAVVGFTLITSIANAEDWTRFRGSAGNGVSPTAAPTEWSPDKNLKWKAALPGAGVSSPIVVGDKIFVTCYSGYGESRDNVGKLEDLARHVVCLERATGNELWSKTIPGTSNEDPFSGIGVTAHGYASHTPVSDGENLYVFLGKSGVIAYDFDGKELWKQDVGDGSDGKAWGSASSPIVHGDIVVIPALAESRAVFGLDKKTGEKVWECPSDAMDNTWATPIVVKVDDERSDIVLGLPDELWGINPKTGALTWAASGVGGDSFYTSAIESNGVIYASVGGRSGGGSIAVKKGGRKDVTESHVQWNGQTRGSFATPVIHNGHMFVIGRGGVIEVVSVETGEVVKKSRLEASSSAPSGGGGGGRGGRGGRGGGFGSPDYGSPVIAGNNLYYTNGSGQTFVLTADAECTQIAVNALTTDSETFSGTPAVSDGHIFIRSNKFLYCVGE